MAELEPATQLLSLDDSALVELHGRLHKSTTDNAHVELHHLVTTEMGRRKISHGHIDDVWSSLEIEIDKAADVDLVGMADSLPLQDHEVFVKELGMTRGDVTVVLTVDGYEMRVDSPMAKSDTKDDAFSLINVEQLAKHGSHDQSSHGKGISGAGKVAAPAATHPAAVPHAGKIIRGQGDEGLPAPDAPVLVGPLSPKSRRDVDSVLGRNQQRRAYGSSYDEAKTLMEDNPTLANVRASKWQSRRDESVSALSGISDKRSEKAIYHAERVMSGQGFLDAVAGRQAEMSEPMAGLSGLVYGLASGAEKSRAPLFKHGSHDQSTHGQRGAASASRAGKRPFAVYTGTPRKGMGDGVKVSDGDFTALTDPNTFSAAHIVGRDSNGSPIFTPERQALHDQIVHDHLVGLKASADPTYVMLGGGPAAGKSTALKSGLLTGVPSTEGTNRTGVEINADNIKEKFPETQAAIALKDTRWAGMAHEESSYVTKRVMAAAIERKVDVVVDGTGDNSPQSVRSKLDVAKASGYKTVGRYVTCPTEVAVERSNARALKTGRAVPEGVIRGTHRGVSATFPEVAGDFDSVELVDNTNGVKLVASGSRGSGLKIHDRDLWKTFLTKAGE